MKKLFFIFSILAIGLNMAAQQFTSYSFQTLTGPKTMTVTYSDAIEGICVEVLSASTDSCDVYGNGVTIDGIAFSHITVGPSENPYCMSNAGKPINYMYLNVQSGCVVRVTVAKTVRR